MDKAFCVRLSDDCFVVLRLCLLSAALTACSAEEDGGAGVFNSRGDDARNTLAEMNRLRAKGGNEAYKVFLAELEHNGPECDVYRLIVGLKLADVPRGPKSEPAVDGSKCKKIRSR